MGDMIDRHRRQLPSVTPIDRSPLRALVGGIVLGGVILSGCATASSTSSSSAAGGGPPCAAGTPVAGDLDGDGTPDLILSRGEELPIAESDEDEVEAEPDPLNPGEWEPAASGGTLFTNSLAAFADLNHDVCADLITVTYYGSEAAEQGDAGPAKLNLTSFLGSTQGPVDPVVATGPALSELRSETDSYLIQGFAVVARDGRQQVMLTGLRNDEGYADEESLHVVTLAADRQTDSVQSFALKDLGLKRSDDAGDSHPASKLALAATDDLVAVGYTGELVGGQANAGAVYLFTPVAADPTQFEFQQRITQDTRDVPDKAEREDAFGYSLALLDGRLAIGAPGETVGNARSAGLVQTMEWHDGALTAGRAIVQGVDGVPGLSEEWDNFGEILALGRGLSAPDSYDVAIGAPMENDEAKINTGALTIANFNESKYARFTPADTDTMQDAKNSFFASGLTTRIDPATGRERVLVISNGAQTTDCKGTKGNVVASEAGELNDTTTWQMLRSPCQAGHAVSVDQPTFNPEGNLTFGWVPGASVDTLNNGD